MLLDGVNKEMFSLLMYSFPLCYTYIYVLLYCTWESELDDDVYDAEKVESTSPLCIYWTVKCKNL